jgi:hypothetical protein
VPAAGGQSTENRSARRRLIEMEGLRIELGSECEGPLLVDAQPPGFIKLACNCSLLPSQLDIYEQAYDMDFLNLVVRFEIYLLPRRALALTPHGTGWSCSKRSIGDGT